MEIITKQIGKRLFEFFEATGLRKAEFGRLLGIRRQHIGKYLDGTYSPERFKYRLEELGCNTQWLATGDGWMFADNDNGHILILRRLLEDKLLHERTLQERILLLKILQSQTKKPGNSPDDVTIPVSLFSMDQPKLARFEYGAHDPIYGVDVRQAIWILSKRYYDMSEVIAGDSDIHFIFPPIRFSGGDPKESPEYVSDVTEELKSIVSGARAMQRRIAELESQLKAANEQIEKLKNAR